MRPAVIAQVAATSALGALLSSFAALYVSLQSFDVTAGIILRALLVTVVLLVAGWFAVRARVLSTTRTGLRLGALLGLVLGYALSPTTWAGRTYAAQLVAEPGAVTIVLDLALWLLVGGVAVLVASAPASAGEPATYRTHR
ncbi:MAG: hypothetical protein IR158_17220 [Cellulomonas sp.]|jgi:hypothetical protein|uniref:hypothetical protein n=1 Tax=Cellulomonas sp. TaxID=40001 RepID=UPI0019F5DDE9|nr:hypothetical protein [Cellulomonas sp.]MBF0689493.1 hypothetical protein [Cellulomonas sp.]